MSNRFKSRASLHVLKPVIHDEEFRSEFFAGVHTRQVPLSGQYHGTSQNLTGQQHRFVSRGPGIRQDPLSVGYGQHITLVFPRRIPLK